MFLLPQVVPILRAGLVLLEQAATLLPASETYHLGYVRDETTLQVRVVTLLTACNWAKGVVPACILPKIA